MSLEISFVSDHGNISMERIVLRSNSNGVLLWNYLLSDSTYHSDGTVSNKLRHVFDFDSLTAITLNDGDLIILYTCKGNDSVYEHEGVKIYSIHWGLNETVWNKNGDEAVLIKAESRAKKKV
ncbi:hypothetical protein JK621_09420 [Serratia plymuthica]|uniref:hypothetical protein n=1 Tax=Serratia plymuthica TaxID=82996 RepID=UPI001BB04283|nr:hypothetical protein [Serratia plymuthica]QUY50340.1 hypothetical protein JK621_09420 [Serratia plymuthica]